MEKKTPKTATPLCRLTIQLARSAPVAVLLRRGPTGWVQMIKWHTDTDVLECGQWFRGRIFEASCDVSDDGELFVYLARKNTYRSYVELRNDVWTAVSRPPFFTALALWPHGGYCGGGAFEGPRGLHLQFALYDARYRKGIVPEGVALRMAWEPDCFGEALTLKRGWELVGEVAPPRRYGWEATVPWVKESEDGTLRLQRSAREVKVPRQVVRTVWNYTLQRAEDSAELGEADFIEFDQRGRLVMARDGQLQLCADPYAAELSWQVLHDFSAAKPETMPPPEWAKAWPASWQQ